MDPTQAAANETLAGIPAPHFALINYFFPGYSMLISTLNSSFGADFERYLPYIIALLVFNYLWSYFDGVVMGWINAYFVSSFTVRTDDEAYDMLMLWTTRQTFAQNTRHFIANTNVFSRNSYQWRYNEDDESDDEDDGAEVDEDCVSEKDGTSDKKNLLRFTPSPGRHWFWYKRRLLCFDRQENKEQQNFRNANECEVLSISCFGRDPTILKELLNDARAMYLKKDDLKTLIYRATTSHYWQRCMSRPNRPFSTVILPQDMKKNIITDAGDYLDRNTRRWYANRGIPYRRGYLLHGPPGTGKSSLSLALAGYFRMKIYIVSLSSKGLNEENLASLFTELPTHCIVLLEDIDTVGITHSREKADGDDDEKTSDDNNDSSTGQLTLSGLLNILDGVAAQEGRLLIMTTNHIEKLDKALIRPGRIDMMVPFKLADREMAASIFRAIYSPFENELSTKHVLDGTNEKLDPEELQKKMQAHLRNLEAEVDVLAEEFAALIPEDEFSPAEVQGLLLRHKLQPQSAVDATLEWVEHTRREKKLRAKADADKAKAAAAKKEAAKKESEKKETEEKESEKKETDEKEPQSEANNKTDSNNTEEATAAKTDESDTDASSNLLTTGEQGDSKDSSSDCGEKKGTSDSGYDTT